MSTLRAMSCVLLLGAALAYTGCSDDDDDRSPFPPHPDAGADAGTDAGAEFTAFVRDLVLNETSDTTTPVKLDDKNFVDNAPTDAFAPAFFQH
ncbi:hypothetical protein HUA74_32855 [Myxococcus sp. CA051A]|uniref:hypothetical protein n=1 Tax=Myxococcus sp. CA051A TaxID=2741739 RepID=UPI00157A5CDF|nr:hypothetical protein [Myxococcus sp. CA051A]NTX65460.1 hypothetical protein [Myxococcus sp. CA051A]